MPVSIAGRFHDSDSNLCSHCQRSVNNSATLRSAGKKKSTHTLLDYSQNLKPSRQYDNYLQ